MWIDYDHYIYHEREIDNMKTAHYFSTRANKLVIISNDTHPQGITIKVSGKKEAREVAKKHNATPWNF